MMRQLEPHYLKELKQITDDIYDLAYEKDWTWTDLAKHAGLCYQTVYRLGMRDSQLPQLRTAILLARAVGRRLEITKTHVRLRKAA